MNETKQITVKSKVLTSAIEFYRIALDTPFGVIEASYTSGKEHDDDAWQIESGQEAYDKMSDEQKDEVDNTITDAMNGAL